LIDVLRSDRRGRRQHAMLRADLVKNAGFVTSGSRMRV
jgi:hypothetical protein